MCYKYYFKLSEIKDLSSFFLFLPTEITEHFIKNLITLLNIFDYFGLLYNLADVKKKL